MTAVLVNEWMNGDTGPFTLELADEMDDKAFYKFCRRNDHLRFERNPDGTILIMPNTGGKTGIRNTKIVSRLDLWSESFGGKVFDSSTAFKLPNFATRSPDAAWISDERWNSLNEDEQERFPPIAPDFVVELMSASDILKKAQEKMHEYIENGVQLAWLIQPSSQTVFIYRIDGTISKVVDFDNKLSGENVLPEFEFSLKLLL
ncbi:Uma2 family endonuclease [Runella salmonicolor]|uniref:Uma2 family endonuclease n=1 Tax=Runella salmonicolor TaxID=2950278 RepID=A0ABT1FNR9_9BACT|nr:Uma2 family endonuclease [Runella salmonicolor]MCP1383382.1 Uma2 family endonuclease [Runella salmonicolor]